MPPTADVIRPLSPLSGLSCLLLACMLGAPPTARAEVTFVSQLRQVGTFATLDYTAGDDLFSSDNETSDEVGPLDVWADCHLEQSGDLAAATAAQLSYILPAGLLAEGNFSAHADIDGAQFAEAFGMSRYTSQFSTDGEQEFHLRASIMAGGNGTVNLLFRRVDGDIFVYRSIQNGSDQLDEIFILPAGSYEVTAQVSGYGQALPGGGGQPASGSFTLSLPLSPAASVQTEPVRSVHGPGLVVFPNPMHDWAQIQPVRGATSEGAPGIGAGDVVIVDLSGRLVRRYVGVSSSGVRWDTRDAEGREVAAGVYLVRAEGGPTTRAVVLR